MIAALIAIALLAAAGYWWWWSRSRPAVREPRESAYSAEPFAAVEIRCRGGSCAAARALEGQRFLASQSPALPLAGCTKARCDCTFGKLLDRRTDDRRFSGLGAAMFKTQRRKRAGRRDGD